MPLDEAVLGLPTPLLVERTTRVIPDAVLAEQVDEVLDAPRVTWIVRQLGGDFASMFALLEQGRGAGSLREGEGAGQAMEEVDVVVDPQHSDEATEQRDPGDPDGTV